MGTMNKLRENTGVILWILVFAFGVVWVLQDSGAIGAGSPQTNDIVVVNGWPISTEQFSRAVEGQINQFERRTGQPVTPQQRDRIRQRTYDMLVEAELLEQAMDRFGITVTAGELEEMVLGEDPHPIIKTYFGDGEGGVDRRLLNNFISNPETEQQWIQIENFLRRQRRREKFQTLLAATVRIPEQDVLDVYRRRNLQAAARYVALPYAAVPDDSVEVTEDALRAYYDEHREDYRRERTYTIQYVALSKAPTQEDTAAVVSTLRALREDFREAENDSLFLARNASARPYTSAYFNPSELDAPLADAVFGGDVQAGEIIGPVFAAGQAHLIKVLDVRPADETYVHARHILLQGDDEEALRQEAEQLLQRLEEGADFAALAREYSDGPSAAQGGDLGWFGPGQMVEPFEEAAFDAAVGEVVGPVQTQFGLHLIKVVARSDQEARLADLALGLRPSVATLSEMEQRLGDLAYYASQSGDFAAEAEREGLEVQQIQVGADQQTFPGLGVSSDLARFLETAEQGAVSEVIELNDQFLVASVEEITPEGYRPFEQVKAQVRALVVKELKQDVQVRRLEQALQQHDDLEALAQALGTTVRTQEGLTFNTRAVPVVGSDPAFVGTVMGLGEGEISRAVAGENAAFVVQTTRIDEPAPVTESERQRIRTQLQQRRTARLQQQWIAALREQAEIVDNRALLNR